MATKKKVAVPKRKSAGSNAAAPERLAGWKVVAAPTVDADHPPRTVEADVVGPSAEALKKKYLAGGSKTLSARNSESTDAAAAPPARGKWVRLQSENAADADVGTKVGVVDAKTGKYRVIQG